MTDTRDSATGPWREALGVIDTLLGSTQLLTSGAPPYEVAAIFRVPAGPVAAYAGELNMKSESHEGGHLEYGELGEESGALQPIGIAPAALGQRLGPLAAAQQQAGDEQQQQGGAQRKARLHARIRMFEPIKHTTPVVQHGSPGEGYGHFATNSQ